jgi:hypothetical protein
MDPAADVMLQEYPPEAFVALAVYVLDSSPWQRDETPEGCETWPTGCVTVTLPVEALLTLHVEPLRART